MKPADPQAFATAAFLTYLHQSCGYRELRDLGDGRWAGLNQFMFTGAILTGRIGDFYGYADRWCFSDMAKAKAALDAWDGQGEPTGWHRHPATGRRVAEDGTPYVMA